MAKLDMTVNLTPNDIKEAIRLYVKNELDVDTSYDDIHIDVGLDYDDRPGGATTPILKGATAKVKRGKS